MDVAGLPVDASTAAISLAWAAYGPPPELASNPSAAIRPHSVTVLAGSMMDTLIPCGFSSSRSASLRPSTANLVAWYQVPSGS